MPYFDLISFYEKARFSFLKKGVLIYWFTQFLLPWPFDTISLLLILVAALY